VVEDGTHANIVSTIKRMPFPLRPRKFTAAQVCAEGDDGDLLFAAFSVDVEVDYGKQFTGIDGYSRTCVRLTPVSANQCRLTACQLVDVGGMVPTWVMNLKVPEALGGMESVRAEFDRSQEVDDEERLRLAKLIKEQVQTYDAEEEALIGRVQNAIGGLPSSEFEKVHSPDPLVEMRRIYKEGVRTVIIRGVTTLDATLEECAAHELSKMTRARAEEIAIDSETMVWENAHHGVYRSLHSLGLPGFSTREWILEHVWRYSEESRNVLETYYEHIPDHPTYHDADAAYAKDNSTEVVFRYERLPNIGGVPQTRLTYTQRVDPGGAVPLWAVNAKATDQLMVVSRARQAVDRSLEVDAARRKAIVQMIRRHGRDGVEYSEEEEKIVAEGKSWFKTFNGLKSKDLDMRSPQTKGKVAYEKGDSRAWGWSTATVRAR
jgi:hypothetical protein